jgi:hypothetical protein
MCWMEKASELLIMRTLSIDATIAAFGKLLMRSIASKSEFVKYYV